jgi:hypothetical protein
VLIFEGAAEVLIAARERALRRELPLAIYTFDMFRTGHDPANRAVVRAVALVPTSTSSASPCTDP